MKDVNLPSGAVLKILNVPFKEAKDLYQACLEEIRIIKLESTPNMADLVKDLVCAGFYSKKIEAALWKCLERCTYNGLKIEEKTFEPISAREDYSQICIEVLQDTLAPFTRGLYVELPRILAMITSVQK